jgi:hypothetical protein
MGGATARPALARARAPPSSAFFGLYNVILLERKKEKEKEEK